MSTTETTLRPGDWFVTGGNGFVSLHATAEAAPIASFRANHTELSQIEAVATQHNAALTKAIADERRACVARADKFCQHFDTLGERFKKQLRNAIRRDSTGEGS